jgi:predicted RNA-binding protein YlqC (UPF0109 family)
MKEFLENLIKTIVEQPDKVEVKEVVDENKLYTYTISVADEDMGRVIGKSGKVINAIRTIMKVMAIRQGVRARVDLNDVRGGAPASNGTVEEQTPEPIAEPVEDTSEIDITTSDLINPPEE